jgi:hypothetical protein
VGPGADVMVRPNLQRKGIGSRLFLYWDQQVEAALGLGLSLQSYTLFRKLQWEDVGPVPCFENPEPEASSGARCPLCAALPGRAPGRIPTAHEEAPSASPPRASSAQYDALWKASPN